MSARRESMLREMGLAPLWRLRTTVAAEHADAEGSAAGLIPVASTHQVDAPVPAVRANSASSALVGPLPQAMTSPDRADVTKYASDPLARSLDQCDRISRIAGLSWEQLEDDIGHCSACGLCSQRQQAVPGIGDRNADWMFVGEGPGAEEDRQGKPFVGPAGQLLDAMLIAIGLKRGEGVYITNAVKCRPPMNRTPERVEIDTCLPYLERQIVLLQPRIIVALGRPAAQALLGTEVRINAVRGKTFAYAGIPVIVTYHPAYLLRNQIDKAKVWADLCFARRVFNGQGETGRRDQGRN